MPKYTQSLRILLTIQNHHTKATNPICLSWTDNYSPLGHTFRHKQDVLPVSFRLSIINVCPTIGRSFPTAAAQDVCLNTVRCTINFCTHSCTCNNVFKTTTTEKNFESAAVSLFYETRPPSTTFAQQMMGFVCLLLASAGGGQGTTDTSHSRRSAHLPAHRHYTKHTCAV